jgi:uncharacterized protein (TIGR02145 family)
MVIQSHKYFRVPILLFVLFLLGCSDEPATPAEIKLWAKSANWEALKEEYVKNEIDTAKTDQEKEIIRNNILLETFKFRVKAGEVFFLQEVYSKPLNIQFSEKILKQYLLADIQIPPKNLMTLYFILNEDNTKIQNSYDDLSLVILELLNLANKDLMSIQLSSLVNICVACDQNSSEFKSQLFSFQNAFSKKQLDSFIGDNCLTYWDLLVEISLRAAPPGEIKINYYDYKPIIKHLVNSERFVTAAEILTSSTFIDTTTLYYGDFQPIFDHLIMLEKYDLALQICSSFVDVKTEGFEKLVLKAIELEKYSIGADFVEAFPNPLLFEYNDLKPIVMYHANLGNLNIARELALFGCIDHPPEYVTMEENYTKTFKLLGTNKMLEQNISMEKDKLNGIIEDANDCITVGGYIVAELSHNAGISEYEIEQYSGKKAILTTYSTRFQSTGSFSLRVKKLGSRQVKVIGGFTENWVEYIESNDCPESNTRTDLDEMRRKIRQNNNLLKKIRMFTLDFYGFTYIFDQEGNSYRTVKIGDQTWMAENLHVAHYRDGTAITHVTDRTVWSNLSTEAYSIYNTNTSSEVDTYGALYNWHAVNGDIDGDGVKDKEIAPEGWHIPSDEEWKELELALGMSQNEAETTDWRGTNEGSKLAANEKLWNGGVLKGDEVFGISSFNALPSGYREIYGHYLSMGILGNFWSATNVDSATAWHRKLNYDNSDVYRNEADKRYGLSIRCVRD